MSPKSEYVRLQTEPESEALPLETSLSQQRRHALWKKLLLVGLAVVLVVAAVVSFLKSTLSSQSAPQTAYDCGPTSLRKEWRTFKDDEKRDYIRAVQCLYETPSSILDNGTVYDDFPYVHALMGVSKETDHKMPNFLPFHRYLLHTYEQRLRDKCAYNGSLAYWDWTIDWLSLPTAPVWDAELGFGGDGDPNGEVVHDHGRCVIDGPFSHFRPKYMHLDYKPHCLSRGFRHGEKSGKLFPGDGVRPEKIDEILEKETFEDFSKALEMIPHNIIPYSIRGEMYSFSSPYDPIFFLHHSNLDRLWWVWQQRQPGRVFEYGSKGSLSDVLDMHGLNENKSIKELMAAKSELMCYTYI